MVRCLRTARLSLESVSPAGSQFTEKFGDGSGIADGIVFTPVEQADPRERHFDRKIEQTLAILVKLQKFRLQPTIPTNRDHRRRNLLYQTDLFDAETARSLLDQLLEDSRLYTQSADYKDLLDFVVRLRNFAPFNAMLLQVQKPALSYAASARDWRQLFGRTIKEAARPLLILWPFGPVALVYDVLDTEGEDLPEDVASFPTQGSIDERQIGLFVRLMRKKGIEWCLIDAGDQKAGSIRLVRRAANCTETALYRININRNHVLNVQFATLAHELGHLFLGHLGPDKALNVPERPRPKHSQQELEAESVAFLVCSRNGVTSKSETYLKNYVEKNTTVEEIDLYQVMRAAGQVETLLGLAAHAKFDSSKRKRS